MKKKSFEIEKNARCVAAKKCEISGKIKEKLRNYWFTKAELLILTLKINFVIRELFSAQLRWDTTQYYVKIHEL